MRAQLRCLGSVGAVTMAPTQSGAEYAGTQSYEGKWAGTGFYPEETLQYFEFYFKGKTSEHTGYMPNELLFETLTTNSPKIQVLDLERRNLDSETMGAIMSCLMANTKVTELKIARNCSFWSEQPDDFGLALAQVLKTNKSITKVDIKNNDIHEDGIFALMDALKTNTTVTWLDMSDNFSRGKGGAIAEMIAVRATLRARERGPYAHLPLPPRPPPRIPACFGSPAHTPLSTCTFALPLRAGQQGHQIPQPERQPAHRRGLEEGARCPRAQHHHQRVLGVQQRRRRQDDTEEASRLQKVRARPLPPSRGGGAGADGCRRRGRAGPMGSEGGRVTGSRSRRAARFRGGGFFPARLWASPCLCRRSHTLATLHQRDRCWDGD